jgi:hypothetical protein
LIKEKQALGVAQQMMILVKSLRVAMDLLKQDLDVLKIQKSGRK